MSDYQRIKAVRYPITKEDFIKAIGIDGDDIGYEFHNKFPGMTDWDYRKFPRFSFNSTVNNNLDTVNYLDYELYDKEGDGDWGKVRELTTKERNKYEKIFKQVLPEVAEYFRSKNYKVDLHNDENYKDVNVLIINWQNLEK